MKYIAGSFVASAVLAGLLFSLFETYYSSLRTQAQLNSVYVTFITARTTTYGVVDVVDQVHRTLTFHTSTFEGDTRTIVLSVPSSALIAQQALIEDRGTYTGLSTPVPATLKDIQPGMHIAAQLSRQGIFTANVILFGNPL